MFQAFLRASTSPIGRLRSAWPFFSRSNSNSNNNSNNNSNSKNKNKSKGASTKASPAPEPKSLTTAEVAQLKHDIQSKATQLGIPCLGFTTGDAVDAETLAHFRDWLSKGYHGNMRFLERPDRLARRENPALILPNVRSAILFLLPYLPGRKHFPKAQDVPQNGAVSSYAWGRDYHDILGEKLQMICEMIEERTLTPTKWYVDTGAIMERQWAVRAGLGFIGKHTLLINPKYGSGFFLGEILSVVPFEPDAHTSADGEAKPAKKMPSCGSCMRCMTACPTQAFVGPKVLDARRCISYLTIELKTSIPEELRPLMQNKIYGCDVCQQACPFNRIFQDPSPLWGSPEDSVTAPKLAELIRLDEEGFQKRFQGSPILRIKRARLLRNVAVAIGNSNNAELLSVVNEVLQIEKDPLVVEHLLWAKGRLEKVAERKTQPEMQTPDE